MCGRPVLIPPCSAARRFAPYRHAAIGLGIVVVAETGASGSARAAELRGRALSRISRPNERGRGGTDGQACGAPRGPGFRDVSAVDSAGGAVLHVAAALGAPTWARPSSALSLRPLTVVRRRSGRPTLHARDTLLNEHTPPRPSRTAPYTTRSTIMVFEAFNANIERIDSLFGALKSDDSEGNKPRSAQVLGLRKQDDGRVPVDSQPRPARAGRHSTSLDGHELDEWCTRWRERLRVRRGTSRCESNSGEMPAISLSRRLNA